MLRIFFQFYFYYLGTVESTIAGVELPVKSRLVKSSLELGFCGVPGGDLADKLVWPCREGHGKVEAEDTIDVLQKVECAADLVTDLLLHAKDVRIVLLEAAYTGQASEGTGILVAVEDTEIGHAFHVNGFSKEKEKKKRRKLAYRRGSSRWERGRRSKARQWPGQFMGLRANFSFSTSKLNMFSCSNVVKRNTEKKECLPGSFASGPSAPRAWYCTCWE